MADVARAASKPFTAARAKRLIGVSKAVAPLLAPYALAFAGVARSRWDAYRAGQLGVEPGQLSQYTGRGGALHARLSRIAETLQELEGGTGTHGTEDDKAFAAKVRPRLADLAVAVRAAGQMPTARRKTAYRAIAGELDRVEVELLTRLGVIG
ncbi:DUF6474 family protein [Pseudonocardia lacus]|uniref:DUF6474 family protein n=1 Tax=Pseudonocardia lacus TaxID=2835865 RepID=UPI001BDD3892|nr:DUF6474 family protein [Pseudonocardia lacus]